MHTIHAFDRSAGRDVNFCASVRSFDHASGVCVIRAGRESHRVVRASLTLLAGTKDARLSVTVEGVAGERRRGGGWFGGFCPCAVGNISFHVFDFVCQVRRLCWSGMFVVDRRSKSTQLLLGVKISIRFDVRLEVSIQQEFLLKRHVLR